MLPNMHDISKWLKFQQDSVPADCVKETVDLLSTETAAFIPSTVWSPNSLDLNLVDHKVWSVFQEQVYNVKVNDVDELCQHIQTVWDELD